MMIRDGRQVVHSLRNFVHPMSHEEACETWKLHVQAGLHFCRMEAARVLPLRYETIVQKPEETFQEICHFLGEAYAPETAAFVRTKPINSSFKGQAPSDGLLPRWIEWTPDEKRHFRTVAGELLIELGYERDHAWVDRRQ
jgi:hypothetical protein